MDQRSIQQIVRENVEDLGDFHSFEQLGYTEEEAKRMDEEIGLLGKRKDNQNVANYYRVTYYNDGQRVEVKRPTDVNLNALMQWAAREYGDGLIRVDQAEERAEGHTLTQKVWSVSDYEDRTTAMAELGKKIWDAV